MPPKQSTLGYVKSGQSTLAKFFGNPNGTKAAPQQSRLAFSSESNGKGKAVGATDANTTSKTNGATKPIAAQSETANNVEMDKSVTTATPKKRAVYEEEPEAMSDDEPPTKRQRFKSKVKTEDSDGDADMKTRGVDAKPEKTDGKSVVNDEDRVEDVDVKAQKVKSKAKPKQSKKQKTAVKQEPEDEDIDEEPVASKATAKAAEADGDEHGLLEDRSDSEAVEESEEDEDLPEIASKDREKLQTTLTSKTKDPYPDWAAGAPVPYAALCTTFSKIEMTTKRLEIAAHCSLFLRQVLRLTPDDLLPTILLMVNKLAAEYTGIELGIGESLIMKAICESTGRSSALLKSEQADIGDLGLVAAKSRSVQPTMFKPKALTVRGVHKGLIEIATIEGQGAQTKKVGAIKKLLSASDAEMVGKKNIDITINKGGASEAKFIIRALEGKMRLGLAEKTVIPSLSQAVITHEMTRQGTTPNADQLAKAERMLKNVFNELPSYEVIIPALLEHGIMNLHDNCKLQPGVPLKPMLAKPTKSISEVLDRFEGKDFTCEYKYDGERAQIHYVAHDSDLQYVTTVPQAGKSSKGISNIFSRNSEDLSKKYPDILAKLPTWVKDTTKSFVLDCETVAWDVSEKKVLPFQQLMTRKRKDVKEEDIKVKVCVFAFDLLFLNGEALVNKSFRERRDLLTSAFAPIEGEFAFAKYGNTSELDAIQILLEDSVKASCEGLMVKMLDGVESHYEPSRRSQNWLKVKKDYLSGVGDSLDLVVLGAYYGKGKRTSVYGAFLLACYNSNKETFETVCNIGTGFSEAVLEELHTQLEPIIIDKPKPFYSHSSGNKDQPDVWFESRYVWEVRTADLTVSPRYKAAAAEMEASAGGKGVSLRFPRFLKVRDDKKPEEATTSRAVAEMYRKQEGVTKSKGPAVDDDFEY